MEAFGNVAARLSRNPLGIIVLFIVLVYGIAGIVFATSAEILNEQQKYIIVWFLVLFPLVVLFSFLWLVSKHHTKLYAPQDFSDDTNFFRLLTPEEQKEKVKENIDLITEKDEEPEHLEIEVELEDNIKRSILTAEELAFNEIQNEFSTSIKRRVSLGETMQLDGMFVHQGTGYGVEIKFIKNRLSKPALKSQLNQIGHRLRKLNYKNFKVLLVFVVEDIELFDKNGTLEFIKRVTDAISLVVDVRIYSLKELEEKYI